MLRWIFLGYFLVLYIFITTISQRNYGKTVEAILSGRISRRKVYWGQMLAMGLPSVVLLYMAANGIFSWREVGLLLPVFGAGGWRAVAASVLYVLYLAYMLYALIVARRNATAGKYPKNLPDRMRALFPSSRKDKRLWVATAISAGITEELLFRGFMLGAVAAMLPGVPTWAILVFSVLLFGLGHLYQGARQAIWPALLGLLYGIFFLAFGSVLPVMLVHALQDLRALWVLPVSPEPPHYVPEQTAYVPPDPAEAEAAREADREEREGLMASLRERIRAKK